MIRIYLIAIFIALFMICCIALIIISFNIPVLPRMIQFAIGAPLGFLSV